MKNLMKTFALLGFVLAFGLVQAQVDAKADKVIKASKKKFDSASDLTASFTYTLSNPNMKKPIVKQGSLQFKKGNKYMINFPDMSVVSNGRYIWQILHEDEELIKSDYTEEAMSPDKIFQVYENDTKSRYDGVEGNAEKITLFANSKTDEIWKTELWIDKTNKLPSKAMMYARNGSSYQYQMKGIKTNSGVNEATFTVSEDGYEDKGYIITDLTE